MPAHPLIALSPRAVAWLRQRLPAAARARVFALAGPGYVAVEDWPPERQAQATMAQCALLALLLHVLLVALIGNAPPGSAAPGQGVWGAINITLRGLTPQPDAPAAVAAPEAYSGPAGTAAERRWGGAVRSPVDALPAPEAGAARLGTWNASPTPSVADPDPPVLRSPAPVQQSAPSSPMESLPPAPLPVPPQTAPDTRTATLPALGAPSPGAGVRPMLESVDRLPEPARQLELPAAPELRPLPPMPKDMSPLPPLPPSALRPVERLAPGRADALALPPLAEAPRPPVGAPVLPLAEPKSLPALSEASPRAADPLVAPRLAETPAAPATAPLVAPPEPRVMLALQPRPAALPSAAPVAGGVPALAAPDLPDVARMPELRALPPAAPVIAPAAATPAAAAASEAPVPPGSAATAPTMATPLQVGPGVPRAAAGSPDAGARAGRDVATPAAEAASAPRLNLELARPRGGEISQQGSRGVLQLLPRPPEIKSKLAEDIEKAARADCRTAHSGAGLLAVGPIVADALRGKGCKW